MTFTPLKAEQIVAAGVGLLKQELVAADMFWKQDASEFTGAKNDTVTLRLPAYGVANERDMRSATAISFSDLAERSISIKLDKHLYHATKITDEALTLDIQNFSSQILAPQSDAVARAVEAKAIATMTGATYDATRTIEFDAANPLAFLVKARELLNKANVPMTDRYVAVGSDIETALIQKLSADASVTGGAHSAALRDATIGRLYGFTIVSVPGLPVKQAYAFHRSAYALATRAPARPNGAKMVASTSSNGFAMRWLMDYSDELISDRSLVDLFAGTAVVTDNGSLDTDGRFTPSVELADINDPAKNLFVRAVKVVDLV
jgi:hypothetical protein